MGMWKLKGVVAIGALACVLAGPAVRPAAGAAEPYATDFGVGVAAVLANVVYMPVKVVYATLGGLTGGLAFCLTGGRLDVANSVWRPSMGGTYVVTPSMLRGQDRVYFSGSADSGDARSRDRDEDVARDQRSTPSAGY